MTRKTRRIKYYLLSMVKMDDDTTLQCNDTEDRFNEIVEKHMISIAGTEHKAARIDLSDGAYCIELIKHDNHIWYLKLGVANPTNSVGIRDNDTLKSDSLDIDPTKSLEINTFCVIDFETRILSYVGMNGSPRVSIIKDWINRLISSEGIATKLAIIYSQDVLKELSKKKRVTKLDLEIAVPPDKSLENLGVKDSSFDNLCGKISKTVSYEVTAERGKTILDDPNLLAQTINRVLKGADADSIKVFSAQGKDDGETTPQTFNLLDYSFTVSSQIDRLDYDSSDDEKRMDMIFEAYRGKNAELRQCIR